MFQNPAAHLDQSELHAAPNISKKPATLWHVDQSQLNSDKSQLGARIILHSASKPSTVNLSGTTIITCETKMAGLASMILLVSGLASLSGECTKEFFRLWLYCGCWNWQNFLFHIFNLFDSFTLCVWVENTKNLKFLCMFIRLIWRLQTRLQKVKQWRPWFSSVTHWQPQTADPVFHDFKTLLQTCLEDFVSSLSLVVSRSLGFWWREETKLSLHLWDHHFHFLWDYHFYFLQNNVSNCAENLLANKYIERFSFHSGCSLHGHLLWIHRSSWQGTPGNSYESVYFP